jgi:hypothetical protein
MPVVRELINLFSFKEDKSSRDNAEKSFQKLAKTSAKIGLGMAAAFTGATAKIIPGIEKAQAEMNFFGVTTEKVEDQLSKRKPGSLFSIDELNQVSASLASLSVRSDQIKDSLSILKDITIARGFKLDLAEVSSLLQDVVKSGDISSLRDLGGISKAIAEQLKRTSFSEAFLKGTEEVRLDLVLDVLSGNRERIKKLAKEQSDTLTTQFERFKANFSDLVLSGAIEFQDTLKTSFEFTNDIMENLIKSGSLWSTLRNIFKEIKSLIEGVEDSWWGILLRGGSGEESFNSFLKNIGLAGLKEQKTFFSDLISDFGFGNNDAVRKEDTVKNLKTVQNNNDLQQVKINKIDPINVNVSGDINIRSNGANNRLDDKDSMDQIKKLIKNAFITSLQENGGTPSILPSQ